MLQCHVITTFNALQHNCYRPIIKDIFTAPTAIAMLNKILELEHALEVLAFSEVLRNKRGYKITNHPMHLCGMQWRWGPNDISINSTIRATVART
jgi:hypothetical protein